MCADFCCLFLVPDSPWEGSPNKVKFSIYMYVMSETWTSDLWSSTLSFCSINTLWWMWDCNVLLLLSRYWYELFCRIMRSGGSV